jgi:hypothetical protein
MNNVDRLILRFVKELGIDIVKPFNVKRIRGGEWKWFAMGGAKIDGRTCDVGSPLTIGELVKTKKLKTYFKDSANELEIRDA